MPFHICMDEINAFLTGLPFIGLGVLWLRVHGGNAFRRLFSRRCSKTCDHVHPALPEARNDQA